jgi:hypothetical protein
MCGSVIGMVFATMAAADSERDNREGLRRREGGKLDDSGTDPVMLHGVSDDGTQIVVLA